MSKHSITSQPATPIPEDNSERPLKVARPNTDQSLPHIGLVGNTYTVLLSGNDTNGRYSLIDMYIPPGGGPPPHRHDFEESFTLLEGEIEATFRGEKSTVRAGETLSIPANAPHSFTNASKGNVRLLCLCAPAGQEEFFAQVGVALATRTTTPPKLDKEAQAASMKKAKDLLPKYRTEMVKPGLIEVIENLFSHDSAFALKGKAMPTNTMKAIRLHEFGGPEVLRYEDAPRPELKAGEVLVRVHAVGINPPDWYVRDGMKALPPEWRPPIPLPLIPGTDVSGVVEAVAPGVSDFSVGDEVFSMVRFPSFGESAAYAEYVTAPASDVAIKPAAIDHVHAAAAPMSGLTAWQFLIELGHDESNPLQPEQHRPVPLSGKTVLVNGAGGGVGHFAVQIAKWKGAHVIAVASGRHEQFVRDLGADEFIDYNKTPPEDVLNDIDLVVDAVGGPATGRFLRTLKRGGALFPVFLGFSDAEEAAERGVTVSTTQVRSNGVQLAELGRLLDSGRVRVAIDSTFPLADARKAHERAAQGHIQGKLVLTVS